MRWMALSPIHRLVTETAGGDGTAVIHSPRAGSLALTSIASASTAGRLVGSFILYRSASSRS
jgi:hypothetical protein